ncbi:hypothetical protein CP533_5269 [Ophiocordyceps camponoti-saundersi (nom. inval.)]|nr:hypothetical protein CP533_5269 [Ophiocordyceps camponoti-saundersi (nom. inval.)]
MILSLVLFFVAVVRAVLVPGPIGAYPVAMRSHELTDHARNDPYSGHHNHSRSIVVSVFLPLNPSVHTDGPVQQLPYMPPRTAAEYDQQTAALVPGLKTVFSHFAIEYARLPTTAVPSSQRGKKRRSYPVVLFSPGLGASRLLYAAGARDLASQGYVVITIDHPYDATIVEFPDGHVVRGVNITTPAEIWKAVEVRVKDVTFLINTLHSPSMLKKLTSGFTDIVDVDKIAMYGHSLGGATAAEAMLADDRLLAGMNWDGQMQGNVANRGLDRPFVQVGVPGHRAMNGSNWDEFYNRLRGPKMELEVANTTHLSFTDMPLLLTTMKVPSNERPALEQILGSVNGRRLRRTLTGILTASLDFVFKRDAEGAQAIADEYCGVRVVKR